MTKSFGDIIRWLAAALLITSGISGLRGAVFRSWIGIFTILWLLASIALIVMGVFLFRYRSPTSNTGRLRWLFGFLGLILLPTVIGFLLLTQPIGGGPGFGGVYAAGAVGQALVLSLYASPIPALVGYLTGLSLDIAKRNRQERNDEQLPRLD